MEGEAMIRKVERDDFTDCLRLFRELWPSTPINPSDVERVLERYLEDENHEIFCYEEGRIIGLVTVTKRWTFLYGGRVAIIEELIVEERFRSRGIGQALVEFVEQKMKQEGIKGIEVFSDFYRTRAHMFWEKMGYEKLAYQFKKKLI